MLGTKERILFCAVDMLGSSEGDSLLRLAVLLFSVEFALIQGYNGFRTCLRLFSVRKWVWPKLTVSVGREYVPVSTLLVLRASDSHGGWPRHSAFREKLRRRSARSIYRTGTMYT